VKVASPATRKHYRRGTHRTRTPAQTLEQFAKHAPAFGITRIANVTGLDYLGIPVFMAMRPNSRSLSVSQGKGLDDDSAIVSALMEAIELDHAERVPRPSRKCSYAALSKQARAADPALLPRLRKSNCLKTTQMRWSRGVDLMDGEEIWVPYDLVHTDFGSTEKRKEALFLRGSNGLSSGNHPLEAICAGLCEVIERDATALWVHRDIHHKAARRIIPKSVRDSACRDLLDRLEERGIACALWNVTTDIDVACIVCRLQEALGNERSAMGAIWGAGCHLSAGVALLRAVTEAAQSRLTFIAGSRDDLHRRDYDGSGTRSLFDLAHDAWEERAAGTRFGEIPSFAGPTFEHDLEKLLAKLRAADLPQAIAVDLTDERFGIPVVRIIVPGLESEGSQSAARSGIRARALARAAT
jgi:YcaO-like protein with predicted kinase domain